MTYALYSIKIHSTVFVPHKSLNITDDYRSTFPSSAIAF